MATGNSGSFNIKTSNIYISGYVSWSETYDIASNSSVVSAELRLSRTNTGYETYGSGSFTMSINGNSVTTPQYQTFSFTYNSNTLCISHSVTVPHNADGSKSIEISISGYVNSGNPYLTVDSQSATVALTTIPRASSLIVPNGTLGTTIRLTVNRASTAFTHTINWSAGGQSGSLTGVGAYVDWSVPYAIANGNTSGTSVTCSFTLITYNNGTEIGRSTTSCTLYIPNDNTTKPTLSVSNITVTNSGNISSWGEAIKGISKLKLSISSSSGKYGASISSRKITTSDGQNTTSTSLEVIPNTSGTYKFSATVTDTRDFTSNIVEKTISVYDYAPPVISRANVERCTSGGSSANEGTYVKINASYGYTDINGKNSITSAYASYRVSGSGSSFTSLGNITNGTDIVLGSGQFNIGASYDIRLTVTDTVGKSDTYDLTLSTAKANIVSGLNKLGLGKYPEKDGYLEIGYNVDFEDPDQARNAIGVGNGLTTIAEKAPDDDPNQITKTGFYSAQHANLAPGSSGRSHILHIEGTGNYAIQFQYDYNQDIEAYRKKLAGVWGDWKDLRSEEITPISKGGTGATDTSTARTNLGAVSKTGDTLSGTYVINKNGTSIHHKGTGGEMYMNVENTTSGVKVGLGVGSSGTNHGIWSTKLNKWLIYGNASTAYCNADSYSAFGWKKASVAFSNSVGTMSASGVTTSSTVLAIRGDSNITGSYYAIGAADCNSAGTIKLAQANGSSQNATWTVSAWWSK